jgi:restriction endonuclease BglII
MKAEVAYFHCGQQLRETLAKEIAEIESIIASIRWAETFRYETGEHQTAYNRAFGEAFGRLDWEPQPILRTDPKLKGDFRKGLVFVEIQFGNSAALYRDYYKFQYGLANGLLSLAVLIVPVSAKKFFPTRHHSVHNMAEN